MELSSGNRYEIRTENFSSTLTIKNLLDAENNQPVTCTLVNPLGKESCDALIKLIAIPKVEKTPGDQSVNLDETLKVKIPIVGKGPFTVSVKKDGEDAPAERYKINELDGTVTFTIPCMFALIYLFTISTIRYFKTFYFCYSAAQKEDSGNYTIAISNDSGTLTIPLKVKVKGNVQNLSPFSYLVWTKIIEIFVVVVLL